MSKQPRKEKRAKKQKREKTVVEHILSMGFIGLIIIGLALSFMCGYFIYMQVYEDYETIAKGISFHSASWIDAMADGEYSYDEASGKLYKGDTEITDTALWDVYSHESNYHHGIYYGDTMVLTDLTAEDGSTLVGSKISNYDEVAAAVAQDTFYTDTKVMIGGGSYAVCYSPLYNSDGIVGYMFTAVGLSLADDVIIKNIINAVLYAFFLTFVLCAIVRWRMKHIAKDYKLDLNKVSDLATDKNESVTEMGKHTNQTMKQINSAVEQVTQAVTSQASHTEEIMGTMEEFGSSIDVIVNDVQNTSEITDQSIVAITDLQKQLEELEVASHKNSDSIQEISDQIEEDAEAVAGIGQIIDVINDIAFQITILSYNASVEAAHAGEVGRGFAVVADSIKDLSDKTKASLEDINTIVEGVNDKMAATGKSSNKLIHENDKVSQELVATKEKLNQVMVAFDAISNNISQVLEESETMSDAKNQVVETVSSLAAMGEENAAMSEEMKASADEVITLTESMMEEIDSLTEINRIIDNAKAKFIKG